MSQIYLELQEENPDKNIIIKDKKDNKVYYLSKKRDLSTITISIIFFILFISVIIIFYSKIENQNKKINELSEQLLKNKNLEILSITKFNSKIKEIETKLVTPPQVDENINLNYKNEINKLRNISYIINNLENNQKKLTKENKEIKLLIQNFTLTYNKTIVPKKQENPFIIPFNKNLKQTKKFNSSLLIPTLATSQINSTIFANNTELNLVLNAIKDRTHKNIKKFRKIFQASIDGDDSFKFHKKCDNYTNTLIVIRSGNRRFGGFSSETWEEKNWNDPFKEDKNAFVFSLDTGKIYPCSSSVHAIYCLKTNGPQYGDDAIFISDKCLINNWSYGNTDSKYYDFGEDKGKNILTINNNKGHNYITDYEVFETVFDM